MVVSIKFEGSQDYQIEAIDSIVDLFEGTSSIEAQFAGDLDKELLGAESLFQEQVYTNKLPCSDSQIISNLELIQNRKTLEVGGEERISIPEDLRSEVTEANPPREFTVEMETGTGKTYVYIRTAIELHQKYGLNKFVIIVPSVAIREGAMTTLRITKDHFREIYSGIQYDSYAYSSGNVTKLRQFATSSHLEILVINIQAFTRDDAIIKRKVDALSGRAPIDFIQAVRPIVILDEPQKLGSDKQKAAIAELNPLFTLRYSATHKERHHLTYRLTPIDAYQKNLVKQIEVLSVQVDQNQVVPFISVEKITHSSNSVTATIKANKTSGPNRQMTIRKNDDLMELTGLELYQDYVVEDIRKDEYGSSVQFQNGIRLYEGSSTGVPTDVMHRAQLRAAIVAHLETEVRLHHAKEMGRIQQIKPLTLFFIDKVINYEPEGAKLKLWFEEEYEKLRTERKYALLTLPDASEAHRGYFARSKGVAKDSKGEGKETRQDDEAFELIMRDKERLLSPEEPVRFIFSHSALAEGWDNPNVFVICNLQESTTEVKRRQQLGRGLRLPVMVDGERCRLRSYNRLVVIANESFEKYAAGLQREVVNEIGIQLPSEYLRKHDSRERLKLKPGFQDLPAFKALWERIKPRTQFRLDFDSNKLIDKAVSNLKVMKPVPKPAITIQGQIVEAFDENAKVEGGRVTTYSEKFHQEIVFDIPDVLKSLSSRLPVSRATIFEIIERSERKYEIHRNPAAFEEQVFSAIKSALAHILVNENGLQYSQIDTGSNASWHVENFHFESEVYSDTLVTVSKSIYEAVPCDSKIERQFAEDIDKREDVELFVKLPDWFKIDTPVGGYNPDWAIAMKPNAEGFQDFYLVRETKGSANIEDLFRESEKWKVTFGGKHFEAIRVDYKQVKTAEEI